MTRGSTSAVRQSLCLQTMLLRADWSRSRTLLQRFFFARVVGIGASRVEVKRARRGSVDIERVRTQLRERDDIQGALVGRRE